MKLRLLDLFSGIGGFSLGLERTGGFETVAFCEIEPFPRRVLAKHWPGVPIYDDVRTLTAERLRADGISIDAICGGFPCQDISHAGKGAGIEGERSGLWSEYSRLIGELRPKFIIVENVSALLNRGIDRVLGDLVEIGYDAEWHCIPASAVGAPHRRDRIWIVAYPMCSGAGILGGALAEALEGKGFAGHRFAFQAECGGEDVADADCYRCLEPRNRSEGYQGETQPQPFDCRQMVADTNSQSLQRTSVAWEQCNPWLIEPDVGRVAHGIPSRVVRLKGLGNAVVPQIPELIGNAILTSLKEDAA